MLLSGMYNSCKHGRHCQLTDFAEQLSAAVTITKLNRIINHYKHIYCTNQSTSHIGLLPLQITVLQATSINSQAKA